MLVLRKILLVGGALLLGAVVGPLALAAWAALTAPDDATARLTAARRLLDAFDDRHPQEIGMASFDSSGFARDCGYDEEQLFGQTPSMLEGESQGWTPYTGYFDLIMWHHDEFRQEVGSRRTEHLSQRLNGLELVFLERCIRHTAFSFLCGGRVRRVLETGDLLSHSSLPPLGARPDQQRRSKTICTYLDGVVARKSLPLAAPMLEPKGRRH